MHASYAHRRVRHLRHYCQKWRDSARVTIDTPISTASRKLASVRRRSFVRHAQRRRLVSKLHVFFAFDARECVDDSRCRHCFARVPGVDQSMFCLIAGAPLRAFLFGLELLSLSSYFEFTRHKNKSRIFLLRTIDIIYICCQICCWYCAYVGVGNGFYEPQSINREHERV